jgi:bla regulator protein blaR1
MTHPFLLGLANHLWQSTVFAIAAMLLVAVFLRGASAKVRHAVLLAAQLKFLIPFALLAGLASNLLPPATVSVPAGTIAALEIAAGEPFRPVEELPVLARRGPDESSLGLIATAAGLMLWLTGFLWISAGWIRGWRLANRRVAEALPAGNYGGVPVRVAADDVEPAVYGAFRPVLLLPVAVMEQLSESQKTAILEHELSHVRRRDNLTGVLSALTQALFWVHPLVWWIGSRLIVERERACDEAVLGRGASAETYAEGILRVCRISMPATPAICASGVTAAGTELKHRIRGILRGPAKPLSGVARVVLTLAAAAAFAVPVFVAAIRPQAIAAQEKTSSGPALRYEVASIRPSKATDNNSRLGPGPEGGLRANNVTLLQLISFAYDLRNFQINGGPSWVSNDRYDLIAKPENFTGPGDPRTMTDAQRRQHMDENRERLRALLAERFQLTTRIEPKEQPVYFLTVAKGGPKMQLSTSNELAGSTMRTRMGSMEAQRMTTTGMLQSLSNILNRRVIDKTGLTGHYDFRLEWTPEAAASPDAPGDVPAGASIFTAIQEQLGLRLESAKAPVDTLVVVKAERPSEN